MFCTTLVCVSTGSKDMRIYEGITPATIPIFFADGSDEVDRGDRCGWISEVRVANFLLKVRDEVPPTFVVDHVI